MKFSTGTDQAVTKTQPSERDGQRLAETLRTWGMVFMTLVFIVLYGLALIGKFKPLVDISVVSRLEPIIFVLLGYYFGRLPCHQNEGMLKNEIDRQTKRADAAYQARETALQSRDALDEKLKNVQTVLASEGLGLCKGTAGVADKAISEIYQNDAVTAALKILNS
jgi:DNA-directed RNA polymerase specialized sigma24 family protein